MRYIAVAETDIGTTRKTNQDSLLVKQVKIGGNEVLMAIICDGMGGLSKGEVASKKVIDEFERWFIKELPYELRNIDMNVIGCKWALLLKKLNLEMQEYGLQIGERLGTTFTGVLFINEQFVAVHVGDTRLYYIDEDIKQITQDHTFVEREVLHGNLTPEQARLDKRRNILLQCVGASKNVEPDIFGGKVKQGIYLLCSDGFRHVITENELLEHFGNNVLSNKKDMRKKGKQCIELIKQRGEKDNISVILIKHISKNQFRICNKTL